MVKPRRNFAAYVCLLGLCLTMLACLPTVENLTKTHRFNDSVARCLGGTERVLVLPLWYDRGPCHFRDPVFVERAQLERIDGVLKARYRLGVEDLVQFHGPSHYRTMFGFLLVGRSGRVVWLTQDDVGVENGQLTFTWRSDRVTGLTTEYYELLAASLGGSQAAAECKLIPTRYGMCADAVAKGLTDSETAEVLAFLESVELEETVPTDWTECESAP